MSSAVLLQRNQALSVNRGLSEADAGRQPLRGYFLTLPANKERQHRIQGLLAAEGAKHSVLPFTPVDDPNDNHRQRVHKAHMQALLACWLANSTAPCAIFEDDAIWPEGQLSAMIAAVESEQRDWDIIMLGMGNGKRFSHKRLVKRLQPSSRKVNSMRVAATLCGCHAYIVNGGRSLRKVYRMFQHRRYRRKKDSKVCVEGLLSGALSKFRLRVVSTRYAFARQREPAGGPDVYNWKL